MPQPPFHPLICSFWKQFLFFIYYLELINAVIYNAMTYLRIMCSSFFCPSTPSAPTGCWRALRTALSRTCKDGKEHGQHALYPSFLSIRNCINVWLQNSMLGLGRKICKLWAGIKERIIPDAATVAMISLSLLIYRAGQRLHFYLFLIAINRMIFLRLTALCTKFNNEFKCVLCTFFI